jgi:flagellar protein FlbD
MISLTRISGSVFVLNADLIERIDSTPDTVISLVDGKKYVVLESPDEVIRAIRMLRSEILAMSCRPDVPVDAGPREPIPPMARLAAVASIHKES